MPARSQRTEKLDLRISLPHKDLLRAAADASRKTMSEFVLESALTRADEVMADQRVVTLGAEAWAAFEAALDGPPTATPRLQRLLTEPGLLD